MNAKAKGMTKMGMLMAGMAMLCIAPGLAPAQARPPCYMGGAGMVPDGGVSGAPDALGAYSPGYSGGMHHGGGAVPFNGGTVHRGWDALSRRVIEGVIASNHNMRSALEALRAASCTVSFSSRGQNMPAIRGRISYAWADRNDDGRLAPGEVQLQVMQVSHPQMRPALRQMIAFLQAQLTSDLGTMLSAYDVKTVRMQGAFKVIATPQRPGAGMPMVSTVTPGFRVTQVQVSAQDGTRLAMTFQHKKFRGKWLVVQSSTYSTGPRGRMSQSAACNYTEIAGVPMPALVTIRQQMQTAQGCAGMDQQFTFRNWRVRRRAGGGNDTGALNTTPDTNTGGTAHQGRVSRADKRAAYPHLMRGTRLMEAKKHAEAIEALTEAIRLWPSCYPAYQNRAICYGCTGRCKEAIADLTKVIALKPDLVRAYEARARVYAMDKQYSKALADLMTLKKMGQKVDSDIFRAVQARALRQKYATGHNSAANAHGTGREQATALIREGRRLMKQKKLDQAIDKFNQAIKLTPRWEKGYQNRGYVYGLRDEYRKALADFNKAVELAPDNPVNYQVRARAHYYLKEYEKAQADIDKAKELGGLMQPSFAKAVQAKLRVAKTKDKMDDIMNRLSQRLIAEAREKWRRKNDRTANEDAGSRREAGRDGNGFRPVESMTDEEIKAERRKLMLKVSNMMLDNASEQEIAPFKARLAELARAKARRVQGTGPQAPRDA